VARPRTPYRAVTVPADELPHFLDIEEAAKLVGIGRSAAYEAAKTGQLPTVRFGRRLRVPRHALLSLGGGSDAVA
jgi:excisionase family DNA binding protein